MIERNNPYQLPTRQQADSPHSLGRLNILPKEIRWLELQHQIGQTPEGDSDLHHALPMDFGDSRFASNAILRAREFLQQLTNKHLEKQFSLVAASVVFESDADHNWTPILKWLQNHPYALKTGDLKRAKEGIKRGRIDIEFALNQPDESQPDGRIDGRLADQPENQSIDQPADQITNQGSADQQMKADIQAEDYIGPHRYDRSLSIFAQTQIAMEEGINCQVLVHLVAEFLGKSLPRTDRSKELFENDEYRMIDLEIEPLPIGAVLFFHERPVIVEPASLHLAVYVGQDLAGLPWVLHATSQGDKLDPAADLVPLSYLLTGRIRYFYGAVEIGLGVR